MTSVSLVAAVAVGLVLGFVGRFATTRGRGLPLWLPPAVGIGAAMSANLVTWMANAGRAGLTVVDVLLQVFAAAAAVAAITVTAGRQPAGPRYDRSGQTR